PAEHLALYEFQPVDIAFYGTGTPVDREAGVHSQPIAVQIPAEPAQLGWTGALNIGYPSFKFGPMSLADQNHEALRQSAARGQLAAGSIQIRQERTFRFVQLTA